MSRRQLPARSTRNQKPEASGQQKEVDNAFYNMIFGEVEEPSRQQERKRQQQKIARKTMMAFNLPSHSYARAHHYYFDLKTFPRLEGHFSYVEDTNNAFGWTFSKEDTTFKGSKLGQLINRIYFGLPLTNKDQRQDDRSKNICHSILFQGEDKKYNLERALYTCKLIYKNIQSLLEKQKIDQFRYIMRKQPELQILTEQEVSIQKKKELLMKIISDYQHKKEHHRQFHEQEDRHHYYFSLNQKLHNKISALEGKISLSIIPRTIYTNQINLLDTIKQNPENLMLTLRNAFYYHQSQTQAIRQQTLKSLLSQYSHVLYLELDNIPLVTLPCQIYSFGPPELLDIVNRIVSIKVTKVQGQLGFYPAKFAWSKLFKSQLFLEKNVLKLSNLEYKSLLQKFVCDLKEFKSVNKCQIDANQYALDQMINFDAFAEQGSNPLFILKRKNPITINTKELLIIVIYSWLCKALTPIYHVLQQNPEYVSLFTSDFYAKYHLYVAEAVGNTYFATFQHALNMLTQHIATSGPLFQFKINLQFDYDQQKRLGIVWKTPKAEDQFSSQQEQAEQEEQLQGQLQGQNNENKDNNENVEEQRQQDEIQQILGNNPKKHVKQNDDVQQM